MMLHKLKNGTKILFSNDYSPVKESRQILITGNPRSGSHTMAKVMTKLNMDVPHENIGEDGTVSCFMFFPATYMPLAENLMHYGEELEYPEFFHNFYFQYKVHLVRHPLKCIRSMVGMMGRPHQLWCMYHNLASRFPARAVNANKLKRTMQTWLHTNMLIEEYADHRIRIEDGIKGVKRMCKKLDIDCTLKTMPHENARVVGVESSKRPKIHRNAEPYTWEDLEAVNKSLTNEIKRMAKRYGYT